MDLSAFYGAFSPACFALLGLWLVAVQVGFNVAWLLLLDDTRPSRSWPHAKAE